MKQTEIIDNILRRTRVTQLNPMQQRMSEIPAKGTFTLLAPAGSGKTLAFAIPFLKSLTPAKGHVQGDSDSSITRTRPADCRRVAPHIHRA